MPDRSEIVAGSAASLNLEGLQPGADVLNLLEKWAANGAANEDLIEAEKRILAGLPHSAQPAAGTSVSTPRAA
jgi:hypothetical protein